MRSLPAWIHGHRTGQIAVNGIWGVSQRGLYTGRQRGAVFPFSVLRNNISDNVSTQPEAAAGSVGFLAGSVGFLELATPRRLLSDILWAICWATGAEHFIWLYPACDIIFAVAWLEKGYLSAIWTLCCLMSSLADQMISCLVAVDNCMYNGKWHV